MRRNIGKIVAKIRAEEAIKPEDRKVSIVEIIDRALTSGELSVGAFSITGIRRTLKQMLESTDDFDRDKFFVLFHELYSLCMAPDMRAKGVFHPSQLMDSCSRADVYSLMGTPPSDIVSRGISAALQRTFDVGTWYHLYLQNILYVAGVLEQAEVPVISKKGFINGKGDGVFKEEVFGEKVLLEIKSMNSFMFAKAVWKPFKKHEFQASIYAKELEINKILYLYVNKNTSEMREFLMDINGEMVETAYKKMSTIIKLVEDKKLPPRTCTEKICDKALQCPYASLCFK